MTRLRLSSPFAFVGIDFTDQKLRRRIWRAAKQIAVRSCNQLRCSTRRNARQRLSNTGQLKP